MNNLSLIPLPAHCEIQSGTFILDASTTIVADVVNRDNAHYFRECLNQKLGLTLPVKNGGKDLANSIRLLCYGEEVTLGEEGYRLEVTPRCVTISASESRGVFNGLQTLRQLLPFDFDDPCGSNTYPIPLPCVDIVDYPQFRWRGFMLDESRHFQGKECVKVLLELMAFHKLNVFHWHLTDDQGWRIQINKYPRLTEVGAYRKGTATNMLGKLDNRPQSGYYTQEEVKEIVAYAAERNIQVVPEIEMPGHCMAALASYPSVSCSGGPFEVACTFGPKVDVFCPGKEETFEFLHDVLDEVLGLFPSPFIHIGGDEVPKTRWRKCPSCQKRIRQQRLAGEAELQLYFTNRIVAYLASQGRRAIGWNQILHPKLDPSAVVQYWLGGRKQVIKAARLGRELIVSPFLEVYLDHAYSLTPLSKTYRFEPFLSELEDYNAHILGVEALLWTEFVPNRARLDYQTFPRLTAFAEVCWTPKERRDWVDFQKRWLKFQKHLDGFRVGYARGKDVEPPWYRKIGALFTVLSPPKNTA